MRRVQSIIDRFSNWLERIFASRTDRMTVRSWMIAAGGLMMGYSVLYLVVCILAIPFMLVKTGSASFSLSVVFLFESTVFSVGAGLFFLIVADTISPIWPTEDDVSTEVDDDGAAP